MAKDKKKSKKKGGGEYVVDMSGYDPDDRPDNFYDGDEPKKGVYEAELIRFNEHTSGGGNEGFRWGFRITEPPYEGWMSYSYSNLEGAQWKTEQIVHAISGGADGSVTLKPMPEGEPGEDSATVKAASPVKVRVRRERGQGDNSDEYYGRITHVLPSDKKGKGGKKKKKAKSDDPF